MKLIPFATNAALEHLIVLVVLVYVDVLVDLFRSRDLRLWDRFVVNT